MHGKRFLKKCITLFPGHHTSIPEESRLYSAILLKLCKKFRPSAPSQEKLVLVLDALSKIEIRILALDEVNFTEVGTAAKQKRFLKGFFAQRPEKVQSKITG